jgi:hypothetical protein
MKLEFLGMFEKNTQIPNLMKMRSVGAEMFHANRQRDRLVAFRDCFAKAPKNEDRFHGACGTFGRN